MQIVIDIDEKDYGNIIENKSNWFYNGCILRNIYNSLEHGTPLPEGHGRLIDGDELLAQAQADGAYDYVSAREIANALTIIAAESEVSDADSN